MLKRLAILAMVLTIAHAPKPTSGQAVDKPTANAQKQNQGIDKEENPSEAAAPVMPKNNSDGTNQREPEKSRDANQNSSINVTNPAPVPKVWHWYEIVAWAANIILVIVGLFGIFAAFRTLNKLERQTKATEDAAKSALLNAQALINSERPWILVKVEARKGVLGFEGFHITAVNRGRTPASIVSYSSNCLIVDVRKTMPAEPECGNMKTVSEILLPDERTHLDSVGDGTVAMYCVSDEKWRRVLGIDAWARVLKVDAWAYVVGRIVYRDLLSPADTPPHETQWAFSYRQGSGGEFYLTPFTAQLGWTKHT